MQFANGLSGSVSNMPLSYANVSYRVVTNGISMKSC
jgi:hypothetical protein